MSGLFFLLFCIRSRPQLIVSHMRLIPPQVPSSLNNLYYMWLGGSTVRELLKRMTKMAAYQAPSFPPPPFLGPSGERNMTSCCNLGCQYRPGISKENSVNHGHSVDWMGWGLLPALTQSYTYP